MDLKEYFAPQVIKRFKSKFNSKVELIRFAGNLRLDMGKLTQSGQIIQDIWNKALKKFLTKDEKIKTVLILGFGAGSVVKVINSYYPNTQITGVEIDPVVIKIAKEYFKIGQIPNLKIINQDAVKFISKNKKHFDLILVDCYQGFKIPKKLENINLLKKLKKQTKHLFINRLYWGKHREKSNQFVNSLEKEFTIKICRTLSNLIISLA